MGGSSPESNYLSPYLHSSYPSLHPSACPSRFIPPRRWADRIVPQARVLGLIDAGYFPAYSYPYNTSNIEAPPSRPPTPPRPTPQPSCLSFTPPNAPLLMHTHTLPCSKCKEHTIPYPFPPSSLLSLLPPSSLPLLSSCIVIFLPYLRHTRSHKLTHEVVETRTQKRSPDDPSHNNSNRQHHQF